MPGPQSGRKLALSQRVSLTGRNREKRMYRALVEKESGAFFYSRNSISPLWRGGRSL